MQANTFHSAYRAGRGEIFYVMPQGEEANVGTFTGGRPAVIVSNDMNNEFNGVIEVVFLTREKNYKSNGKKLLPTDVVVSSSVPERSVARCGQIYTVSKTRIGKYVGQCSIAEMHQIEQAMAIGLCTSDIFQKNNIANMLKYWEKNMKLAPDTEILENIPEEYGENAVSEEEPAITVETVSEPEIKPEAEIKSEDKPAPVVIDIFSNPEYIRAVAERDVYKKLYEELLAGKYKGA